MSRRPFSPVPPDVAQVAGVLERRFAISVLYASRSGARRFGDFTAAIGSPPPSTLSARLSELVEQGLMERRSDGTRVEYRLTAAGRQLANILGALAGCGGSRRNA
jgi:DNA-binding HxlR family transcriptional regulator